MPSDICPACAAVAAPPSQQLDRDRIPDDLPIITSNQELDEKFGLLIVETELDHIVEPQGLLAVYQLDEKVRCSLRDRTLHNYGVVAQVRCGLTLRIGNVCGRHNMHGFDEIDALARSLVDHAKDTRSLDEQPRQLQAFYKWLYDATRPLLALQNKTVREAHPAIYREIVRRSRLAGGERTEVIIQGEPDTKGKTQDYSISLNLDFMLMEAGSALILADTKAVDDFIRTAAKADTRSRKSVRRLVASLKKLSDRRHHWESWMQSTRTFFTRRNLEGLIYATYEPRSTR